MLCRADSSFVLVERQKQKKLETKLYREKEYDGADQDEAGSATNQTDDVFNRPANALQVNLLPMT